MPPRKSDASKVAVTDVEDGTPAKETSSKDGINIEDLNLPKSIVTRLAKGALPANTQIQANAMLAMTKAATVFVNYLAAGANENAGKLTRKTISPQDVFKALEELEFGEFVPRLEGELQRFIEIQSDKRTVYRKKVAADKTPGKVDGGPADGDGEPAAKKARRDAGAEAEDTLAHEDEVEDQGEAEEEEGNDDTEEEEDDGEDDARERLEGEEQIEEEEPEAEDEAMDNGEDSD